MDHSGKSPASSRDALIYGLYCAPLGVVIGIFISLDSAGSGYRFFYVYAGLAAFLTAAFFWRMLIERPNRPTTRRAVAVGVLSGLLSHWLCWYLMLLWANVDFHLLGGSGSSLGEAPMGPLLGIAGVLALCFWSWLIFGWLTVATGVILAIVRQRSVGKQAISRSNPR